MRRLKGKSYDESKKELKEVEDAIAQANEEKAKIVKDEINGSKNNDDTMNANKMWKLKKRLCPSAMAPPSAMLDKEGNLLTTDEAIKERALEVYAERLAPNEIVKHLENLEKARNDLCESRLKLAKMNKTKPWDMDDLTEVLKNLENYKSRDAEDHVNELFKESAAGYDLLKAILKLMNLIKEKQKYPKIMKKCKITSLHKKESKKEF